MFRPDAAAASPVDLAHRPPSALAAWPILAPIVGRSPAPVFIVARDGTILFANHGLNGEPGASLEGVALAGLVPPMAADRVRTGIAAAFAGRADSFEICERGVGGPASCHRADASPIGEPVEAALIVFSDITALKREEDRLRRSEALLVDAQGVAHMGTWEWDVTQPHAVWSAELYRIYGLTPQTYTPSYEEYLKKVHPDDRELVMRETEACFKEHKPYSHDERVFRPNGEVRWLHTWAVPILDENGKLVRLMGVCQDVTENKRAEGAMRAQLMTRALARRLLHDIIGRANVPDAVVRDLGRGLAAEHDGERAPTAYVRAFSDMGFGALRLVSARSGRYEFSAIDLLERKSDATQPTCFLTLGYLEGAVTALTGKRALGNEMRCQSMGHSECRFTLATQ